MKMHHRCLIHLRIQMSVYLKQTNQGTEHSNELLRPSQSEVHKQSRKVGCILVTYVATRHMLIPQLPRLQTMRHLK